MHYIFIPTPPQINVRSVPWAHSSAEANRPCARKGPGYSLYTAKIYIAYAYTSVSIGKNIRI